MLEQIKQEILAHNIDIALICMNNFFCNTTANKTDIELISGFTGSAGDCIISQTDAILCVDDRYFIQAKQEVDHKYWSVTNNPFYHVLHNIAKHKQYTIGLCKNAISYEQYLKLDNVYLHDFRALSMHHHKQDSILTKSFTYSQLQDRQIKFRSQYGSVPSIICDDNLISWLFCIKK